MKRIRAVIFDCDGVMFDSRQANINYYNNVLKRFGLPAMSEKQVDYVHMHTADAAIRHIFQGTNLESEAQAYRKQLNYAPFIKDMVMEPGLKSLLNNLKPHYGLAVATNRGNTMPKVLETFGLTDFFDIVVSSLDVQNPKPHPESLIKILHHFEISAEQTFYVGDSLVDQQTAEAAGVSLISYRNADLDTPLRVTDLRDIEKILHARDIKVF